MTPPRVLVAARPGVGGAARVIEALLRRLPERGVRGTAVLSAQEGGDLLDAAREYGWDVARVDMERAIRPVRDTRAGLRLRKLAAGHDLVHAHAAKAGALARLAIPQRKGVPVIYAPHGLYFAYHDEDSTAWKRYLGLEQRLAPRTTLLHCVSPAERELALRHGLGTEESCFVLPNPVPPPRGDEGQLAELAANGPLVVMAARLSDPKDPVTFVRAANAVDASLGAQFVLVGEGELLDAARHADTGGRVLFLPRDTAVRALLQRSRVAVLSSGSEALPLFLLEALAEGVPSVASDLPGCRDAAGDAALYVPLADAGALARGVETLLRDPDLHAGFVDRARRRAPAFSEDAWIDGVLRMYEQVLHREIT